MKFKFILLFLIVFTQNLSQTFASDFKLSGIVLDSLSGLPMENATVQLHFEDNLIKSNLSKEDGNFQFLFAKKGNYSLTISHIGYKTQIISVKIESEVQAKIIIKLQIEGVDLKEISVRANKPLVFQKNGEITYQIEGGIWQNSGNTMSIINRIPILKGRSGSSYLLYGSKVTFLLDGKPIESQGVNLETIMANYGSSEIDKIEILSSPPPSLARYGRPIVNIKTIKMKEDGALFNMSHGFGRGINNRFNNGVKYALKHRNLLFGLSAAQSKINQQTQYNSTKIAPSIELIDSESNFYNNDLFTIKLDAEYSGKKLGTINFSFDHKNTLAPSNKKNEGHYVVNNQIDSLILTAYSKVKSWQNMAGIAYHKEFNKYFNIKTTFDIGQFDIDNKENIRLLRPGLEANFENPWARKIVFKNYYLENESNFGEVKLTTGLIYKISESGTDFIKNVGAETNKASSFTYLENIFTTFATSNYTKGKTDFTAGINLENTEIEGFGTVNSEVKKVKFYSLLPNFSINHQFSDAKFLNLSYNRGINRPEYEWLNQQELYKNPYNKNIGGGVLLPTIYNKVTLASSFQNGLTITGIYAYQKNRYSFFPFITAENIVNFSAVNVEKFSYLYYSAAYQKYLSQIWYFSADVSGYYSKLHSKIYGINNGGYTQQFSISNFFTFKKIGQFGLSSSYNTTDYADSYQFLPQFSLNVEYSKSIFKKNGSINISYSDITNSLKDRYIYKLENFSVKDSYKYETRLFKISINYKFGNKNVKGLVPENLKAESEIERLK